jgi:hypothetical protein
MGGQAADSLSLVGSGRSGLRLALGREEWSVSEAETGSPAEIKQFRQRQIPRTVILGATAESRPLLEESYLRILAVFEPYAGSPAISSAAGGPCPTVKAVPRCLMEPPDCRTLKWGIGRNAGGKSGSIFSLSNQR